MIEFYLSYPTQKSSLSEIFVGFAEVQKSSQSSGSDQAAWTWQTRNHRAQNDYEGAYEGIRYFMQTLLDVDAKISALSLPE